MADVGAVEQIVAVDAGHVGQRIPPRFGQVPALAHHEQHAASVGENPPAVGPGPHVINSPFDAVQALDLVSFFVVARIALRGQHDAQRGEIVPLQLRIASLGHGTEDVDDVALQARQHHLGLGIAETGVELDDLDTPRSLHQSAVEHALEGTPLGDHCVGHGLHDLLQRIAFVLRRHERQGRIGAHTARIGTLVAVVGPFVVLRQRHRPHLVSRNEAHERKLGTFEVILDDHLALAELVVEQHIPQRRFGLGHRPGDHHAFSGGQSVVFQHCGQRTPLHIGQRPGIVGECAESGCRDGIFSHQPFGELLRRFDARRCLRRTEDAQPRGPEAVDDTRRQRHFGTHDREADAPLRGKVTQAFHLGFTNGHALGLPGDARIPGCAVNFFNLRRTRQRVDNGVFAASAADNQYLHKQNSFLSQNKLRRFRHFFPQKVPQKLSDDTSACPERSNAGFGRLFAGL